MLGNNKMSFLHRQTFVNITAQAPSFSIIIERAESMNVSVSVGDCKLST